MTVTANKPASDALRLKLESGTARKATLDGGWWPRTRNATDELPALLAALGDGRGDVTHVLLSDSAWDLPHPRRLGTGRGAVRLGWYASQPAGLVTVMTDFGEDRFDLAVVPADATPASADAALAAAADSGDHRRAAEVLDGIELTR